MPNKQKKNTGRGRGRPPGGGGGALFFFFWGGVAPPPPPVPQKSCLSEMNRLLGVF